MIIELVFLDSGRGFLIGMLFFVASIAGGLASKSFFDYAMIIGFGLGIIYLLYAAYFTGKNKKDSSTQ